MYLVKGFVGTDDHLGLIGSDTNILGVFRDAWMLHCPGGNKKTEQLSTSFYRWETAESHREVGPAIPTVRLVPSGCSLCLRCTVERIRSLVST